MLKIEFWNRGEFRIICKVILGRIIKIKKYRIHCVIGAHPHERETEQELSIDIEVKLNIQEAVQTDSIVDTIDYEKIAKVCSDLAKTRRYHLLETFAYEALNALLDEFLISWIKLRVVKKQAIPLAEAVVIELEKSR